MRCEHWRAVLPWVRSATRQRGMAPWSGAVSPGNAPAGLEFLVTCLAEFPDARLSRVQVQRQEGYSDGSGWDTPPSIQVNALLEFPDDGSLQVCLEHWPEQEQPRLEEWARQQLEQRAAPA